MESTDDCRHFYSNILDLHRRLFKVHFHRNLSLWRPHQTLIKILLLKCFLTLIHIFSLSLAPSISYKISLTYLSLSFHNLWYTHSIFLSHNIFLSLYSLSLFHNLWCTHFNISLTQYLFCLYNLNISHTIFIMHNLWYTRFIYLLHNIFLSLY